MPLCPSDKIKHCDHCHTAMHRKRYPSGHMEPPSHFHRRRFCSIECYLIHRTTKQKAKRDRMSAAKRCEICSARMLRIKYSAGYHESDARFERRKYCSRRCLGVANGRRARRDFRFRRTAQTEYVSL